MNAMKYLNNVIDVQSQIPTISQNFNFEYHIYQHYWVY